MMLNIGLSYSMLPGKSFMAVRFFLGNVYGFRVVQKYLFTVVSWHAYLLILVAPLIRYLSALSVIDIGNWYKVMPRNLLGRKSLIELFRNFSRVSCRPSYHVLFMFLIIKRLILILVIVIIWSKLYWRLLHTSIRLMCLRHYCWSTIKVLILLISFHLFKMLWHNCYRCRQLRSFMAPAAAQNHVLHFTTGIQIVAIDRRTTTLIHRLVHLRLMLPILL